MIQDDVIYEHKFGKQRQKVESLEPEEGVREQNVMRRINCLKLIGWENVGA